MTEGNAADDASSPAVAQTAPAAIPPRKNKNKVRSAWISFVSRILAQLIGAAATVFLGFLVFQRHQESMRPKPSADTPVVREVSRPATGAPVLAVLPFANYSGDARDDHLADAMTEVVVSALARVDTLRVLSRTSSMPYKGSGKPLPVIGRELGVDLLVEGSVARSGSRTRIIAQLIDARTDEHVWARSYVQDGADALALEDEVGAAIVRDLKAAIGARQWQVPKPESRNVAPATGTNSQR
jgi:TolB-like protein